MATAAAETRTPTFPTSAPRLVDNWTRVVLVLIVGYLSMTRSFAYLGIPWISLYIGEISLGAFLLFGPRAKQGLWFNLMQRAKRLRRFQCLLLLLLFYGAFEAFHGIVAGYPVFTALRDTAFNYYPLFLFLGVWVGLRDRNFLRRALRALAWWNGCYGLAYVLFLNHVSWTMPGTAGAPSAVPVFGQPYGSAVALLGLLAFESNLRKVWYLIALNTFVMLGLQIRAEWVGFVVGLCVFAWYAKRIKRLVIAGTLLVGLLGAMYMVNISLPGAKSRLGRVSIPYIVARAVAPFNKGLASNLVPAKDVQSFAGTAEWRLVWWVNIWEAVHATVPRALFGFGYGYPIGTLNPFIAQGYFIQTPHNDFFYALGFSGWIGVILYILLQAELLRLLLRSYKITGQPVGLMCWAALLAGAMFDDFFEAPFGAIPFFLLIGIALAPALLQTKVEHPKKATRRSLAGAAPVEAQA